MNSIKHDTFNNTYGYLVFILLVLGFLTAPCSAEASNLLTTQPVNEIPEFEAGAPDLAELLPRLVTLSKRRIDLKKAIMALPEVSTVTAGFLSIQSQIQSYEKNLDRIKKQKNYSKGYLASISTDLQNEAIKLNRTIERLNHTFKKLEENRRYWANEKRQWESWRDGMPETERKNLKFDQWFATAHEYYTQALDIISETREKFLPVQRLVIDIQNDIGVLEVNIEKTRMQWKTEASQRAISPPLFTVRSLKLYNRQLLEEIKWGWKSVELPGWKFFQQEMWVVGGQLALLIFLVWLIFRNRSLIDGHYPDHYFTRRPFSTALFVSVNMLAPYYKSADPILHLALVVVIGLSGIRLAPGFASRKGGVLTFYVFAFLAVMILLLPTIGIPLPLVRLAVFGGALVVFVLSVWRLFLSIKKESKLYQCVVGFSALIMVVVLSLEIIGDSARASYLFSATIETFFLGMVAWMLMRMAEGALDIVVRSQAVQKIEYLRRKTGVIITGSVLIIRLVIGFVLISYYLETWSLAENTMAAVKTLLSLGISFGTFRIDAGLCISVIACFLGSMVFSYAIQAFLSETTYKKHDFQRGVRVSISKIIHYSFVLIGFLLVLKTLGVEMKNITIIGGALGVGIGFGLQGIARNFIAGIILLFERPVKVGDYVTMEGKWGEIKSMGLRSAVVRTFDYSEIVVPNHDLIEQKVVNWTLSDRLMRIIVKVGVAYGSDVERVKQILEDCAMASSKITRMPSPQPLFTKFGDSSLNFELRVWITNIDDYMFVTSFLHEEIDKRFRKEGIVIAFPQRDLHMKTPSLESGDRQPE